MLIETALDSPSPHLVCRLRLIGHMEAWTATGESVLPIGRKTRAMLAVVALSAPRPVLRTRLADMLWSRRHEEQARASLRQELHRLLEALQPLGTKILDVTRDHVVLRPGLVWVDAHQVFQATAADPSALTLLEGELLGEFDDIDPALDLWLAAERDRLRDQARTVAEAVLGEQAQADLAIPAAQRLLSIDRSHEGAWRALMQGYAARGERGKAIQAYEQCRGVLTDLLNAAPLPDTQRLAAEIRAGYTLSVPTPARAPDQPQAPAPCCRTAVKIGALAPHVISAGTDEAQFSLGLAEEVTVALTRFGTMLVVSSSSLAQLGDRNEPALRSAFGLDFLLDGSVQRSGQRLRVTLRLLDLRDGSKVVWTYRTDRQITDLLSLQDEVAAEVSSQVDLEILRIEGQLAADLAPDRMSAHDLVLASLPLMARMRRDEFREAGEMLERALKDAPDHAPAHAWRAWWLVLGIGQGWAGHASYRVADAVRHAELAVALDPQNARALAIAGHVRASLQHRIGEAMELYARALLLNPNLAMAWGLSAAAQLFAGELDEASQRFAQFKRLSPTDPYAFVFDAWMAGLALLGGDVEAAVALGRQVSELGPAYADGLKYYLAALGHAGKHAEAQAVLARIRASEPRFSIQTFLTVIPFARTAERDRLAAGLQAAGAAEDHALVLHG